MTVLKDFYAKAAKAKAAKAKELLQVADGPAPATWDSDEAHKGHQAAGAGIIAMLDVILSDFARLEKETIAAERKAEAAHDDFLHESKLNRQDKTKDIDTKKDTVMNQEAEISEKKEDLEQTQEELDVAKKYFEKLKEPCLSTGMTYAERVAAREAEIEALKEALNILSGEGGFEVPGAA